MPRTVIDSRLKQWCLSAILVTSTLCLRAQNAGYDYPLNECFTYSYKMSVGDVAGETTIKETFTAEGGITYVVGYIEDGGITNGMLQEISMTGDIFWSRLFSVAGRNLRFNSIRQVPGGMLMITGTSSLPGETDKKPFISQVDLMGNILWSKTLDAPGFEGRCISPSRDLGSCFAAQNNSDIIYGRIDNAGNIAWVKRIKPLDNGSLTGVVHYNQLKWFIGYSGVQGGRNAGTFTCIQPSDGSIDWTIRFGGTAASEYIFHDLEISNLRPRICGIYKLNNGIHQLFKATINVGGFVESLQSIQFPAVTITASAKSTISPWADVIAFTPGSADPDIYIFKTINETGSEDRIAWKRIFTGIGNHELINVERTFDGGSIVSCNKISGALSQGYLLKTDSIGTIKDCPGAPYTIASSTVFSPAVNLVGIASSVPAVSLNNVTVNVVSQTVPFSHECKSLTCTPRPAEDPCLKSFARRYRSASFSDAGSSILVEEDNKITISGFSRENPYDSYTERSFLAQLSNTGNILSRKNVHIGNLSIIQSIHRLKDGNLAALGSCIYPSAATGVDTPYVTISKFDANLQFLWNRSFPVMGPYSSIYGMVESSDGSMFINYVEGTATCKLITLMKLKPDGTLDWAKNYSIPNLCVFGYVGSVTQDDDYIYIANYADPDMALMKINKQDGAVIWARSYNLPWANQTLIGRDIAILDNDIVVQGKAYDASVPKDVILIIDKNGNLKKHKAFSTVISSGVFSMLVTKNNELAFLGGNSYSRSFFYRLDKDLNILFSKQTNIPGGNTRGRQEGEDGSIFELGLLFYENQYESDFAIKKYTYDGLMGSCFADTLILTEEIPPLNQRSISPATFSANITLTSLPYRESNYSLQENGLMCTDIPDCNSVQLPDIANICDSLPFTIDAERNAECMAPVSFVYEGAGINIISQSESSITMKITKSGPVKLKAKIFTGCVWIEDEKTFDVIIGTGNFNLGSDTSLCANDSIELNAGPDYLSYQWNNGSADSIITVKASGKYYVDVLNKCSIMESDTVNVFVAPDMYIELGTDTSFCKGDSVSINAGNGFVSYKWSHGPTEPLITLKEPGKYSVIATTQDGCKFYDTLSVVSTWTKPVVSLNDQSMLCEGAALVLDAGQGYSSYLWQDGSTGSAISVSQPGIYYVTVHDIHHCKGTDTAKITGSYSLPSGFLPADIEICQNTETEIRPLSQYQSYRWNNNQQTAGIFVKSGGEYWLEVKDEHNCVGRDTINVIMKECIKGFHMPTAFSPNNDGKNDKLIPYFGGVVKYYQLIVFNRWGHVVFQTNDILKGWNGELNGRPQDSNGFAWSCVYQLEGGEMKKETGIVMLVR